MADISVIIPTCNRSESLRRALESIRAQTMPEDRYEVVVIDNGSSDATPEMLAFYEGNMPNVRYVREPEPGLHNARHRGMHEATAEFLSYIDDDVEVFPGWLEGVWQGFAQYEAVLVGGRNLPKWEAEPPSWLSRQWRMAGTEERYLGALSLLDFGDREKDIDPAYVWGCNFSIRKSVLIEAGGFHPDSMPEELLRFRGDGESYVAAFVARKGHRAVYMPSASVYHCIPRQRMTVKYFRKRAFNQGISDSYTQLRAGSSMPEETVDVSHPLRSWLAPMSRKLFAYMLHTDRHVEATVNDAYQQGFKWHAHSFANDEEVRSWVLKENYLVPR